LNIRQSIKKLEAVPSMRCLMTAGEALERDNVAGFNCSFVAVDNQRVFDEILYVLMCGTGVGFSVERQFIQKLPEISETFHPTDTTIHVADSKIGWAKAFRELVSMLYAGQIPKWDLSKLRPAGAKLKTFGGRSSGPEPLNELFEYSVALFKTAAGRKFTSLEAHDLVCKVAAIVVVGGVRRSALISLSNLSDGRMRGAKVGSWWMDEGQRALANNSAVYTDKPAFDSFMKEWESLYESKSGERGIFSRTASQKQAAKNGRRDSDHEFGTNPCSEIILRPNQFCNLSEAVVRADDTLEDLKDKVRVATILGTLQSTLTNFRYLRKVWENNTAEECLLGVSLTGIMDHPVLSGTLTHETNLDGSWHFHSNGEIVDCRVVWEKFYGENTRDFYCTDLGSILQELKEVAVETNKEWAKKLGVNQSTAITCVKPSGTVSQLVDSASGIHPRYSPYYIRRVRADKNDPLCQLMEAQGFPCEQDVTSDKVNIFSFPMKAPDDAVCTEQVGAMDQLKLWEIYQDYWCEHKPSITVYYKDSDFLEAGQWVYNKIDKISGISFLPYSDHTYQQAPYEEITAEQYQEMLEAMPQGVDWSSLNVYEKEDTTTGSQTMACTGGVCEIVDLVEEE